MRLAIAANNQDAKDALEHGRIDLIDGGQSSIEHQSMSRIDSFHQADPYAFARVNSRQDNN